MAEINYDALKDGKNFSAASINDGFTTIVTGLNDIESDAMQEHSLREEHFSNISTINKVYTQNCIPGVAFIAYTNYFNLVAPANWVVVHDGAGNNLEVLAQDVDFTVDNYNAVLILVNVNVRDILDTANTTTMNHDWSVGVAVELQHGGAWHHLVRSRRFVSKAADYTAGEPSSIMDSTRDIMDIDVPIRTLIRHVDIGAHTTLQGVRVVVTIHDYSGTYPADLEARLGLANLTFIPLQCEAP